jgi:hypothetical protein
LIGLTPVVQGRAYTAGSGGIAFAAVPENIEKRELYLFVWIVG